MQFYSVLNLLSRSKREREGREREERGGRERRGREREGRERGGRENGDREEGGGRERQWRTDKQTFTYKHTRESDTQTETWGGEGTGREGGRRGLGGHGLSE